MNTTTLIENPQSEVIVGQWQSTESHSCKNDGNSNPKLDLVDVFRQFEGDFPNEHDDSLSSARRPVMKT